MILHSLQLLSVWCEEMFTLYEEIKLGFKTILCKWTWSKAKSAPDCLIPPITNQFMFPPYAGSSSEYFWRLNVFSPWQQRKNARLYCVLSALMVEGVSHTTDIISRYLTWAWMYEYARLPHTIPQPSWWITQKYFILQTYRYRVSQKKWCISSAVAGG